MKTYKDIRLRIPEILHQQMLDDLRRPHAFAYERVGFLYTKSKILNENNVLIVATDYVPVDDDHYIEDESVGAKINSAAIRSAMGQTLKKQGGCFHVHLHNHRGKPFPSKTDQRGLPGVVESLSNIAPNQATGILILSKDSFYASIKVSKKVKPVVPTLISVVSKSMSLVFSKEKPVNNLQYQRQSFLGKSAQFLLENIRVGIIGYGGGGSHIGQQLAHLGVKNIIIFDDDKVEDSNLNRMVGAHFEDIKKRSLKTTVAARVIKKIIPTAKVICVDSRWQQQPEMLQMCDVVVGCVDTFSERQQAEAECRRYLIPYIDIGMDVHPEENGAFSISGQVILSVPGYPCMQCYQFLTSEKLTREAAKYGKIGGRPQVVWPNGILASTAVGLFVDLITDWSKESEKPVYLAYNGTSGAIEEHIRTRYAPKTCSHFPLDQVGPPVFSKL